MQHEEVPTAEKKEIQLSIVFKRSKMLGANKNQQDIALHQNRLASSRNTLQVTCARLPANVPTIKCADRVIVLLSDSNA